jgi:hypothetical protein
MVRCPTHRNRQKVRWLIWGVWFGLVRLPGDSNCEAAHGVGGSMVRVTRRPTLGKDGRFGWKGLPDGGAAARCGKGCGALVLLDVAGDSHPQVVGHSDSSLGASNGPTVFG